MRREAGLAPTPTRCLSIHLKPVMSVEAAKRVHLPTCGTSPCTTKVPVRTVTGADGRSYRIDTYVIWQTVSNGTAMGRNVKLVTIVVRDETRATLRSLGAPLLVLRRGVRALAIR